MSPPDLQTAVPHDTDDTRGYHLRSILGKPITWIVGGIIALAVFVGVGLGVGPLFGFAGAALVGLLVVGVAWFVANSAAQKDFFRAYAEARGLAWQDGHRSLPPATPLLRKGDSRYAEEIFSGALPGGRDGTLALYTYVEESTDSKGNTEKTYHGFTVAIIDVPSLAPFVQRLYCQQRHGFRFLDSAEDVFRRNQRVELESDAVDRRYEIFAGERDDINRVRQVLEPSFEVWLAEQAPKDFAFELEAGALCCNVKGHRKSAAALDELCEAADVVAKRMLDEAVE